MKTFLLRLFFKILRKTPADMEMVRYWQTSESVQAKVTKDESGAIVMKMEGEKYTFPGFPRGYLLFGKLSKLKHEVKNQIFNHAWGKLEDGMPPKDVVAEIQTVILPRIFTLLEEHRYDMVPPERMVASVKEIHRAWTAITDNPKSLLLRDLITYVLQEDDSYRFRLQWVAGYFNPNSWFQLFSNPISLFEKALMLLENAEVIGDMKERIRLFRRIILTLLTNDVWRGWFIKLSNEIDWKKVRMTRADKFFFRGKYFKVDLDRFEY
jgi:hypothetical protein